MTEAGGAMRVQRVVMPNSGLESWTVLGDEGVPHEPVERFLAYLSSIERSPSPVVIASRHDRHLAFGDQQMENRALRNTVEQALGEQRTGAMLGTTNRRDTPGKQRSKLIGPC